MYVLSSWKGKQQNKLLHWVAKANYAYSYKADHTTNVKNHTYFCLTVLKSSPYLKMFQT